MFFASIETDQGEVYRLTRPDGYTGGKPLISLVTPLFTYCRNDEKDLGTDQWMNSLQEGERQAFCQSVEVLESSIFSMERDYSFIEYEYFNTKIAPGQFSKEQYQEILEHAMLAWASISILVAAIEIIEKAILHSSPLQCYWYEMGATEGDLVGLKEALLLGKSRGAEKARINIV